MQASAKMCISLWIMWITIKFLNFQAFFNVDNYFWQKQSVTVDMRRYARFARKNRSETIKMVKQKQRMPGLKRT